MRSNDPFDEVAEAFDEVVEAFDEVNEGSDEFNEGSVEVDEGSDEVRDLVDDDDVGIDGETINYGESREKQPTTEAQRTQRRSEDEDECAV
jgi:hypothetical protein